MTDLPSMDLAQLRAALEAARARNRDREGPAAQPIGDLAVRLREAAVSSLMAMHGCDRTWAFQMLADAQRDREEAEAFDRAHPEAAIARESVARARREAERLITLVGDVGMPVRPEVVAALVSGTGLDTRPTQDVHRWVAGPRRVIVLLGDMGTGKTVAACVAAIVALRARQTVAYVRETDVVRWRKSGALASEEKLERLHEVGMLIVDELDQTLAQDAEQAGLGVAQLVDTRVRGGRTVLVGNMTLTQFVQRYGRRCADRIREIGEIHEYRDKSMRGGA